MYQEAHQHNVPCRTVQTGSHPGELPQVRSFVSILPSVLIITAIKKAEHEDALIVRCYNASDETVTGEITFFQPIKGAKLTNLNEEPVAEISEISGHSVSVEVRPWEIKTIQLTF